MLERLTRMNPAALLAVALSVALGLVLATPSTAQALFADTAGTAHEDAVVALVEEGILVGCDEESFCSGQHLTRGQLASALVAALGLQAERDNDDDLDAFTAEVTFDQEGDPVEPAIDPETVVVEPAFADIAGTTHEAAIAILAAAGITQGCDDDAYCPRDAITRAQLASLLVTAFELPPTEVEFFDDAVGVHGASMNRLAAAGIAAGCGNPLPDFCGSDTVTRAHASMFLARALGLVPLVSVPPLEERRAEQAAIDAAEAEAERQRIAEEEAARKTARDKIWDDLAQCESGGNWSINTGNGYYGGLQFTLASWRSVGGSGYPHQHSRTEQILRAERLLAIQGWGAWPACSRKLGYR